MCLQRSLVLHSAESSLPSRKLTLARINLLEQHLRPLRLRLSPLVSCLRLLRHLNSLKLMPLITWLRLLREHLNILRIHLRALSGAESHLKTETETEGLRSVLS